MCQQLYGLPTFAKESLASKGSSLSFSTSINSENIGYPIWKDNSTVSFLSSGVLGIVDLFRATRTYIWCIECQLFITVVIFANKKLAFNTPILQTNWPTILQKTKGDITKKIKPLNTQLVK